MNAVQRVNEAQSVHGVRNRRDGGRHLPLWHMPGTLACFALACKRRKK